MSRPVFSSSSDRCTQYSPTLLALFDGQTLDIAHHELTEAHTHLQECAACRKQWRDWKLTRDALRATTPPPPAGLRVRVNMAVRLHAPFESMPTPPRGLRDAILRATVGVKNAVDSPSLSAAFEEFAAEADEAPEDTKTFAPQNTPPSVPVMAHPDALAPLPLVPHRESGRAGGRRFKAKIATAWLTPVAAAWLMFLSVQGPWNDSRSDIALPTLQSSASLRNTARSVAARTSRVLNRLHLGGVARSVSALRSSSAKTPATMRASDPEDARGEESGADSDDTDRQDAPTRLQLAPRAEAREIVHRESVARRDRFDAADRDESDGPRFQLAGWHPSRPEVARERNSEVSEPSVRPVSLRIAQAPALSTVPERHMNGARGGTWSAPNGHEEGTSSAPGRVGTSLASRGGRRTNLSTTTRNLMSRLNGARFAPTHVANPQLVSRVSWGGDASMSTAESDADAPLRIADHRPDEVSEVVDGFRAALDDEE